jgi:hypothetical protein
MKKLFFFPFLMFLILAMISCEKDQIEPLTEFNDLQELAESRGNATVPFKGEYRVTVFFEPCGNYEGYLWSEGKATHLGESTWEACSTIHWGLGPIFENDCHTSLGFFQDGTTTFTAANGAQLFGTTTGIWDLEGLYGCGEYTIHDGSGRFEGYTGEGTYFWHPVPGEPNYLEFNGTLTKP